MILYQRQKVNGKTLESTPDGPGQVIGSWPNFLHRVVVMIKWNIPFKPFCAHLRKNGIEM